MVDDWGDFSPLPDWDNDNEWEDTPDDFFNDSANFSFPDLDETIFGSARFDDESALLDTVFSGLDDVGETIDWFSDEESQVIDDALTDDDNEHFEDDWLPEPYLFDDDLEPEDEYGRFTGDEDPSELRGPFPDADSAEDYLDRLGAVAWFSQILYDWENDIYYVEIDNDTNK